MATVVRPPIYVPRGTDDALWVGRPLAASIALLTAVAATPPPAHATPRFVPEQTEIWQGAPRSSQTIAMLAANRPFSPPAWRNYAEDTPWLIPDGASATIQMLAAKQPSRPFIWWRYQEDAPWQPITLRNTALLTPQLAKPFSPPAWFWSGDQSDAWRATPTQALALITPAAAGPPPRGQIYRPPADLSEGWQWRPSGTAVLLSIAPAPFVPARWRFDLVEDARTWQWSQGYALALYQTLPFRVSYPSAYADAPVWQWAVGRNLASLSTPLPTPPPGRTGWRRDAHHLDAPLWTWRPPYSVVYLPTVVLRTDPRFITDPNPRVRISAPKPRIRSVTPRVKGQPVPQCPDLSPLDPNEEITNTLDLAPWLPTGVTVSGIISVTGFAYQGTDAAAATRVLASPAPSIGPSPSTGAASSAVLFTVGNNPVAGVTYRWEVLVQLSDGIQKMNPWAHQACSAVN